MPQAQSEFRGSAEIREGNLIHILKKKIWNNPLRNYVVTINRSYLSSPLQSIINTIFLPRNILWLGTIRENGQIRVFHKNPLGHYYAYTAAFGYFKALFSGSHLKIPMDESRKCTVHFIHITLWVSQHNLYAMLLSRTIVYFSIITSSYLKMHLMQTPDGDWMCC